MGRSWKLALAVLALAAGPAASSTWDHTHGDAANSGFADVTTIPARTPLAVVSGMGSIAPGVGPVIGPDGTVYIGDEQGVLWAVHPDGSPYWHRALDRTGEAILAPPVVDTDGAIYLVATYRYTDHRVDPAVTRSEATLYRFTPGGGIGWSARFPDHGSILRGPDLGSVSAGPNILHQGEATTIVVPVMYRGLSDTDVRLVAFSAGAGAMLADTRLGIAHDEVTGTSGFPDWVAISCMLPPFAHCLLPPIGFHPGDYGTGPDALPAHTGVPMQGVAIAGDDIVATDVFHSVIHLGFDPATGFAERSRLDRDGFVALTGSTVLPNGESVTAETDMHVDPENGLTVDGGHLLFTGPLETQVADGAVPDAPPAHTGDGRIVFADDGRLRVLDGQTLLATVSYPAETMAAPAISRNEIYVSTASSLRSYDVASLALTGTYDWAAGGLSTPAIGPTGRIYALAGGKLYVWPAPYCVEHAAEPRCSVRIGTGVGHGVDVIHARP